MQSPNLNKYNFVDFLRNSPSCGMVIIMAGTKNIINTSAITVKDAFTEIAGAKKGMMGIKKRMLKDIWG